VKRRIGEAAIKAGRSPDSIRLVVVSKQAPSEKIISAYEAGAECFGENKIQEAVDKIENIKLQGVGWHFIGHLQKNKIKYINSHFDLIHSVDSLSLAEKISEHSKSQGRVQPILLQINISGEEAKFGLSPSDLVEQLSTFAKYQGIRIKGLMTIPPQDPNPESSRHYFSALRLLRDKCQDLNIGGIELNELSMGMTSDYKVAIEEGATLVRIGTAIFGLRS
jgi:pyridoxal phosphate enzyme (YggS family)